MRILSIFLIGLLFFRCTTGDTEDEQTQEQLSLKGYITSNIFSKTEIEDGTSFNDFEVREYRFYNLTPESFYTYNVFKDLDWDVPSQQTVGLTWNFSECYEVDESPFNNGFTGEDSEDLVTYITDRYTFEFRRSQTGLLVKRINTDGSAFSENLNLSDQETLNNDIASRPSGVCITDKN